jgi:hypothetical protein
MNLVFPKNFQTETVEYLLPSCQARGERLFKVIKTKPALENHFASATVNYSSKMLLYKGFYK